MQPVSQTLKLCAKVWPFNGSCTFLQAIMAIMAIQAG
jgi:hypothetical protein